MDNLGKYIVLEGPDFSGKDTQAQLLVNRLRKEGIDPVFIREPGTGWLGDQIRRILLSRESPLTPEAEMLLFMANRSQILRDYILPNLQKGKIVISNRDRLSSWSYQGYGRGLSLEIIKLVGDFAMKGTLPDLYLILMMPLDMMMQRRLQKLEVDRIEQEEQDFYEKVFQGYRDFIDQNPAITAEFDASLSIEAIHEQIVARVKQLLG